MSGKKKYMWGMYRVWCKNNKEWERGGMAIKPNGFILHISAGKSFPCMVRGDTHTIEFFTGIHDTSENKIPVFDNDIISGYNSINLERGEKCDYVGVVRYKADRAYYVVEDVDGKFIDLLCRVEGLRVVGNIHQHSHLLKGGE